MLHALLVAFFSCPSSYTGLLQPQRNLASARYRLYLTEAQATNNWFWSLPYLAVKLQSLAANMSSTRTCVSLRRLYEGKPCFRQPLVGSDHCEKRAW